MIVLLHWDMQWIEMSFVFYGYLKEPSPPDFETDETIISNSVLMATPSIAKILSNSAGHPMPQIPNQHVVYRSSIHLSVCVYHNASIFH